MIRDDHRKPLAHYGAPQGRARSRLAPPSYTTSRDATDCAYQVHILGPQQLRDSAVKEP